MQRSRELPLMEEVLFADDGTRNYGAWQKTESWRERKSKGRRRKDVKRTVGSQLKNDNSELMRVDEMQNER